MAKLTKSIPILVTLFAISMGLKLRELQLDGRKKDLEPDSTAEYPQDNIEMADMDSDSDFEVDDVINIDDDDELYEVEALVPTTEVARTVTRKPKQRKHRKKIKNKYPNAALPPPSSEKRLTSYLLENYRRVGEGGRPTINSSDAIKVHFGMAMIQMGLDEKDNTLTISVWCRYRWTDEYITWNPDDFGGVKTVRLSSNQVWIPDIMLYNTADTHNLEREVLVVISHNGSILWIPHRIYRSSCSVDVTDFPFDHQTCQMTFGSWAYHGNEIDLRFSEDLERMDISDLERDNTEWEITAKREKRKIQYYDCCAEPYVTLIFTLELKRKLVFSSFILTLPCIFLACMTLVVFWLPPERPDRTSLAMNLFASFLLLLLILVEAAPPTASSVPLLGIYYCFNMVLIMLSIFMSSVIINVSRRGETLNPVPGWLRTVSFGCLTKIFCVKLATSLRMRVRNTNGEVRDEARPRSALFVNPDAKASQSEQINGVQVPDVNNSSQRHSLGGSSDNSSAKLLQLRCMENTLIDICRALKEKDITKEKRELRLEWQVVALTFDRVFFCIFVIAIVLSLVFLFPKPY